LSARRQGRRSAAKIAARFTHTTKLEGLDLEIPIWPSSSIAEITLPLQRMPNRFSLAAVIKNMTFVGASLTTSYVLRVCNGKPACIDTGVAPDTTFGDKRAWRAETVTAQRCARVLRSESKRCVPWANPSIPN
jgi:hypothetical protein